VSSFKLQQVVRVSFVSFEHVPLQASIYTHIFVQYIRSLQVMSVTHSETTMQVCSFYNQTLCDASNGRQGAWAQDTVGTAFLNCDMTSLNQN
jgi:hypothetical protein